MTTKLNAEELLEDRNKLLIMNTRLSEQLEGQGALIEALKIELGTMAHGHRLASQRCADLEAKLADERTVLARLAELRWNSQADNCNQWQALGDDEKDELIERLASALASAAQEEAKDQS